jgi:molybdopterin-synthase adenylyltransferase
MDRYRKQILFDGIGEAGQRRLIAGRAAVIGCGALGSVVAESLVRAGVGFVRIADRDFVDLSNLQRQVLYDEEDVRQRTPKAIAAAEKLRKINSEVTIEPHVVDVTSASVLELVRDVDVILDGTDNFETRFLINDAAVETGIPWVHGGCVGSHGQVMSILPGRTPCFRCLMPEVPAPGSSETCDTAGVIGPAVQVVASLEVVEAFKILSGQVEMIKPELTILDVWEGTLRRLNMENMNAGKTCPCCSGTDRSWLRGEQGSQSTVLCGRNSVQIAPSGRSTLSLDELAGRLQPLGTVRTNPFLLVFSPNDSDHELTLFTDGRAIISGTEDLAEARHLYSRFVGQ